MEEKLNWLIKEVTNATDAAANEIKKYVQAGFIEVRTKLNSLYDVVLKRAPESETV